VIRIILVGLLSNQLNILNISTSFIRWGLWHQGRKLETNARPTPGRSSSQNAECRQNETFDVQSRKNDRISSFCRRNTVRKYKEKRLLEPDFSHSRHCLFLYQFSKFQISKIMLIQVTLIIRGYFLSANLHIRGR